MSVLEAMTELAALLARGGEAAEGAARVLRSMSSESRAAALGAGAVLAVLPYMRADTPPMVLKLAAQTFRNLCTDDNRTGQLELVSPALPLVSDLLLLDDRDVLEAACAAVRNITDGPSERTAAVLAVPGLTARLVALMSREPADVGVQEAALAALGNMLSGTNTQVDRCINAGCLESIISLLASSEPSLVAHAARATGNVFKHTRAMGVLERDALPRLRDVLATGSGESLKQAAKAVGILCCKGSPAQRGSVLSLGVLEPYCAALARADDSLATLVLAGLEALLQAEERDETKYDSEDEGKVKSLCMKLGEVGVLDRIQALLQRQVVQEGLRQRALELSTAVGFYVREEDRIFEEGKEFTPAKIVEELQSRELAPRVRAARAARRMLCRARGDGPARLQRLGGILVAAGVCAHLLAAARGDHCSDLQEEAVWALAHITKEKEHVTAVVEGGAIPTLVALLTKEGEQVGIAEQAAVSLGHIASYGRETRDAVLSRGTVVHAMLPHLRPETPPARLRNYARTFLSLCEHHKTSPPVLAARVSPALPYVTQLLGVGDRRILVLVCRALDCLIMPLLSLNDYRRNTEALQAEPGLTAGLMALLGHEEAEVQGAALKAVRSMLTGTDDQRERCLDAGCLDHLVRLLCSRKPALVKDAAWVTSHILRGTETQIFRALEKGILTALRGVLEDERLQRCLEPAAWAITNLCWRGSVDQRARVVASGVLAPYCKLLTGPKHELVNRVGQGLEYLLYASTPGPVEDALCSQLREIRVRDMVMKLRAHNDQEVKRQAARTLELLNKKNI